MPVETPAEKNEQYHRDYLSQPKRMGIRWGKIIL
jgi:hypothetical protein